MKSWRFFAVILVLIAFSVTAQDQKIESNENDQGSVQQTVNNPRDIDSMQEKLTAKDAEISRLKKIVDELDKTKINMAWIVDKKILDTTAAFFFKTNGYGKVAVQVNGNGYDEIRESNDSEHLVSFSGLKEESNYSIKFYSISPSGRRIKINSDESGFVTQKGSVSEKPLVTIQDEAKNIAHDSIVIGIHSDEKIQVEIYCMKRVPGLASPTPCPKYGEIKQTKVGRHLDGIRTYQGRSDLNISGLEPDAEYEFSGKAVNDNGIFSTLTFTKTYRTRPAPSVVDFNGPVKFEIRPDSTIVSWKWTSEPSSSKVIMLSDGGVVNSLDFKIVNDSENKSTTATIPMARVMDLIGEGGKNPPVIRVQMERNGQDKVIREFSFGIVIPKAKPEMSRAQKTAIESATEVFVKKRGKLNWETISQIGLPILFSFL